MRSVAVLVLAAVAVACGSDDQPRLAVATTTTTTTAAPHGPALPGERVEIYPYRGARLAVVGVAAGDTLKVRSGPGTGYEVIDELEPLAMNATATGHNRSVPGAGFWSEITVDDRTGWAATSFLLQPGRTQDVTATLFPTPGDRPKAATVGELGRMVGRRVASDEPPSDIVVVDEPDAGGPAEVTVDVVGLGDDSVGGERLRIVAEPARGGGTFSVRTVESTALCSRGVTDDGLCV